MFFAHFCLRPVATTQLLPPQRLPLLCAVLGRFFVAVTASIVAILLSGLAIMLPLGMASAPLHWHIMLTLGLPMIVIFSIIVLHHYPRLKGRVAASDWPAAGQSMNRIRVLVATNLAIGAVTVVVATVGSYVWN